MYDDFFKENNSKLFDLLDTKLKSGMNFIIYIVNY